jgi:hypothetical protein
MRFKICVTLKSVLPASTYRQDNKLTKLTTTQTNPSTLYHLGSFYEALPTTSTQAVAVPVAVEPLVYWCVSLRGYCAINSKKQLPTNRNG